MLGFTECLLSALSPVAGDVSLMQKWHVHGVVALLTISALSAQIKEALRSQAAHDVAPPELSPAARYIQDDMSREGYRHLLAVSASRSLLSHQCRQSQPIICTAWPWIVAVA